VCELLGASVAPAARLGIYFKRFRPRAEENREGWGIAWAAADGMRVVKEPRPADESDVAARLAGDPPLSTTFIVHVRAATVGAATVENTHPFCARALGRDWVFAHNGTVLEPERLDPRRFEQLGATDSELAFHHLLGRLVTRFGDAPHAEVDDTAIAAEVLAAARELSERESKANFLLTDGRTLFAYYDGHKTMHVLERRAVDLDEIDLGDDDYAVSLRLADAPDERAAIVASVPLTEEPGWRRLEPGEFLVLRGGLVVDRVPPRAAAGAPPRRASG
jgi:predicted glutamine amidotransferase